MKNLDRVSRFGFPAHFLTHILAASLLLQFWNSPAFSSIKLGATLPPVDPQILIHISDSTGLSLNTAYQAIVSHNYQSISQLLAYAKKTGTQNLKLHYQKQLQEFKDQCTEVSNPETDGDNECLEEVKRGEKEFSDFQELEKTAQKPGQAENKIRIAFAIYYHQVMTDSFQNLYSKIHDRCKTKNTDSCRSEEEKLDQADDVFEALQSLLNENNVKS